MLNMQVPQSPSRGDFRLNAMAWLPLVLMVIAETNTGEIHVPASRDFYSSWHLTEEFIKHFCKNRAVAGRILVSSSGGRVPYPEHSHYSYVEGTHASRPDCSRPCLFGLRR